MTFVKHIKPLLTILFIGMAGLFTACEKTPVVVPMQIGRVTLSITVPNLTTKALGQEQENTVDEIDVLIFDKSTQKYVSQAQAEDITDVDNDNARKTFTVDLPFGNFDLVFLANASYELSLASVTDQMSKAEVAQKIKVYDMGKWNANPASFRRLPMWGELPDVTITETTTDLSDKKIYMMRSIVRIDVSLSDEIANERPYKYITSVRLYNRYSEGQVMPNAETIFNDSSIPPRPQAGAPSIPTGAGQIRGPLTYLPEELTPRIIGEIYTLESHQGTLHGWDSNTCLVIGIGSQKESGSSSTRVITPADSTHYYRLDFTQSDNTGYVPLIRNHCYSISIKEIVNEGFWDPEEAYRSEPYGIGYEVAEMTDNDVDGDTGGGGSYFLDLSATLLWAVYYWDSEVYVDILTNHPDGWSYTIEDDWIHFKSLTPAMAPNVTSRLTLDCDEVPNDYPSWIRYGSITITAGQLTNRVRIVQEDSPIEVR